MAQKEFQLVAAPRVHVGYYSTLASAIQMAGRKGLTSFFVYRGSALVHSVTMKTRP